MDLIGLASQSKEAYLDICMQLEYMNTIVSKTPVHVLVEHLQVLWALTTTVSQELVLVAGSPLSTLMTHCGTDKT